MIKKPLFYFMMLMVSLSAVAGSVLKTREEFVHYPDYQKKQLIIETMKLMVELEARYQGETHKYGYSQERFETFQKIVTMISEGLISTAEATEAFEASRDWNTLAANFNSVRQTSGSDKCVFAGWISTTYTSGSTIYCRHPARNDRVSGSYPSPVAGSSCNSNNQIQCNPLIFGYKSRSTGSTFCVTTNERAKNSSFHCMKKALGDETEVGADSAEDRLNFLKERWEQHPEVFNNVQKYIYQACLCSSAPENFNVAYRNAINNHRTCYGLMRTIGSVGTHCELPPEILPSNQAQDYRSVFTELQAILQGEESVMDQRWREFRERQSQTNEYKRTCGEEAPERREYSCDGFTCTTGEDGSENCTFLIKVQGTNDVLELDAFEISPSPDGSTSGESVIVNFKENGQDPAHTTCQRQRPSANQYTCERATCTRQAAATAAAEGGGQSTEPAPEDEADRPASGPVSCTLVVKNASGTAVTTTHTTPEFSEADGENIQKAFSVTIEGESQAQNLSCPTSLSTTQPDPGDEREPQTADGPTLTVSIKNAGETHYLVRAEYSHPPGWTFSWESEKNEEAPISVIGTDSGAAAVVAGADDSLPEGSGSSSETNQKRLDTDYKVFGVLTKAGEEPIRREAIIQKVAAAAEEENRPLPAVNPNLQSGQQMMIRGTSDTSAGGIR